MKTLMKFRTVCIAALCLLGLNSCGITITDGPKSNINTIYKYINQSSTAIEITMIGSHNRETLRISLGGYKEIPYRGHDHREPFVGYTRIEISNGTVIVKQRNEIGSLFDDRSYESLGSIDYVIRFDYTFTDDFFKDGTPIAEE